MKEKENIECLLEEIETVGKVDHTTMYRISLRVNSYGKFVIPYFGDIHDNDIQQMTGNLVKYHEYETGLPFFRDLHQELIGSGIHYHSVKSKSERKRLLQEYFTLGGLRI